VRKDLSVEEVIASNRFTKGFDLSFMFNVDQLRRDCIMFLLSFKEILMVLMLEEMQIPIVEDNSKELSFSIEDNFSNDKALSTEIFSILKLNNSEICSNISFFVINNSLNRDSKLDIMDGRIEEFSFCNKAKRSNNVEKFWEIFRSIDGTNSNLGFSDINMLDISRIKLDASNLELWLTIEDILKELFFSILPIISVLREMFLTFSIKTTKF
jgi:hypothetical protein